MKTIMIAGVSVNADKVGSLDYDVMMSLGLKSRKYNSILKAKELISKELAEHGIKPKKEGSKDGVSGGNTSKGKNDKSSGDSGSGDTGKKGSNS